MWEAWIYLTVSVASLTIQTIALIRILSRRSQHLVRRGLARTATCRVAASTIYVGLGVAALNDIPHAAMAAFIALIFIQCLWQLNGILDSRLAARLAKHDTNPALHADVRTGTAHRLHNGYYQP